MKISFIINRQFSYPSQIALGDQNNDISVGDMYLLKDGTAGANVILVHGWRMDSLDRMKKIFLKPLKSQGWNIYFFTLPYHYQRNIDGALYSGEYLVSANVYLCQ